MTVSVHFGNDLITEKRLVTLGTVIFIVAVLVFYTTRAHAQFAPASPEQRGSIEAERFDLHNFANLRTESRNFGMVGSYLPDPADVDLSMFHLVEAPKAAAHGSISFVLAQDAFPRPYNRALIVERVNALLKGK